MRFEKNMRLPHGMRNIHFSIPWKTVCLHITTHAIKLFFSKRTFNARSSKHMFYKTPILCMLLNVRKTCVNERSWNMSYSIYTFTIRLTYV